MPRAQQVQARLHHDEVIGSAFLLYTRMQNESSTPRSTCPPSESPINLHRGKGLHAVLHPTLKTSKTPPVTLP